MTDTFSIKHVAEARMLNPLGGDKAGDVVAVMALAEAIIRRGTPPLEVAAMLEEVAGIIEDELEKRMLDSHGL